MQCPHCSTTLRPVEYEGITIETCNSCGGEYLDSDELGHIIRAREEYFDEELRLSMAHRTPMFGVPTQERDHQTCCPQCSAPMDVLNYCGDSGIFVDRCPDCGGFWLDRDELELVQIFQFEWEAKAPGMIQKIAADLERSRREVAEQTTNSFGGSRFAFVNALINRFLDAA